jgi:A/G-specific adenine glycosylase
MSATRMNLPQRADIATPLLTWWDTHGRHDLPWQKDPTPYRVWVSEIMLQQTQVATVERYYERFMGAFPDVAALADAPEDRVLHHWSGLGYYARARNLHRAARLVRDAHGGVVPAGFEALADLPGIGRSTAAAILALGTGTRHAILDGNVKRVLSRVFLVEGSPAAPATQRELWSLAERETPTQRVGDYTQAVMDLGATLCTRRRPGCAQCPLTNLCMARQAGRAEALPAAKPRRARPQRATVVLMVLGEARRVLLEKRPAEGIWGGLWGLPEVPGIDDIGGWCTIHLGAAPARIQVRPVLRHGFTHFDLDMTPVEIHPGAPHAGADRCMDAGRWLWYNVAEPREVGLAAPVSKLLASLAD